MTLQVLQIIANIVFVVVFFGLCIIVHEFGHLLAALWRGLYVQRFSIGFGKKVWGTTYRGVEYIVSALPFGGYVALPQLDPTDEPKNVDDKLLPQASPQSRMITAVAGPLANVAFGFFLGLFVWWLGIYRPAPTPHCDVLDVPQDCPEYQAGLRPGDRIVGVNGQTFKRGWEDLSQMITLTAGEVTLRLERRGETLDIRYRPAPNPKFEGLGFPLFTVQTPLVVFRLVPGAPAAQAGVQPRDQILRVDAKPVTSMQDFIGKVRESAGAPLTLVVLRDGREVTIEGMCARQEVMRGEKVYQIGIVFGEMELTHPNPWEQFTNVFSQTRNVLTALFARDSLVRPQHMSGPIGIVQIIWIKVASGGFREGLWFIVFVTFSLAIFNLLPIPVLDGGHVVFGVVELIIRRRVPTRIAYGLQNTFAVLLIAFMLYVTFFDVKRIGTIWRIVHDRTEEKAEPKPQATPPPAPTTAPAKDAPAAEQPAK
ncbi:MAG: RIP metalloprotease RseP [Lentisphaerae bacterium RIFOXYB12_FULL_65_16]|nr:MAG: RIP metalloprotease RseP [Lentisphaerae bacterium RIFOXYA12_64_32]OGV84556.1 MAG: RIP metalloprotease RseP [Lentisphaerae bacterium RIFOXYB12_FULL_65_16]